ncbi:MAG: hypothetical protein QXH07_06270 [Thermoplasmata archaeon]
MSFFSRFVAAYRPVIYNIYAAVITTSSTPNTPVELSGYDTEVLTIKASSSNTAPVLIGPRGSVVYPLEPGEVLQIYLPATGVIYAQSSAASQTLYLITGGYTSPVVWPPPG